MITISEFVAGLETTAGYLDKKAEEDRKRAMNLTKSGRAMGVSKAAQRNQQLAKGIAQTGIQRTQTAQGLSNLNQNLKAAGIKTQQQLKAVGSNINKQLKKKKLFGASTQRTLNQQRA